MKRFLLVVLLSLAGVCAQARIVFEQAASATGGVAISSWLDPDGSDADMYVYESFIVPADDVITGIEWRGGYNYGGTYGRVWNFTISFYPSIAGGSQPACGNPQLPETYLAHYDVGGVAGETLVGNVGGINMYDYGYTFPTAFPVTAGVKYWVRVEAAQTGYPDWGWALATPTNNSHFQFSTGAARFSFGPGDTAFRLLGSDAPMYAISATVSPTGAGTVTGAASYPQGSTAHLSASANPGFGFVNWTENGNQVSSSPDYQFTVNSPRSLVANFVAAYAITTAPLPTFGGVTSGDGTYNDGVPATVRATPYQGFQFLQWSWFGTPVSSQATYTFSPAQDMTLTAEFVPDANSAVFDFDTGTPPATVGQSIPLSQTSGGLTASFSSPSGSLYSVQSDSTTFYHLSQFSANYLMPSTVYMYPLDMQFDQALTGISFIFATADLHQAENPSTIRLRAYANDTSEAPVGSITAQGVYAGDTFPMGRLAFTSATPFRVVRVDVSYSPQATGDIFFDNITATAQAPLPTPTPSPTPTPTPSPTPTATPGPSIDTDGDGFSDWVETTYGGDPNDPNIKPYFGDYYGDGAVDVTDALWMGHDAGQGLAWYAEWIDVNMDGVVDMTDATLLWEWATGNPGVPMLPAVP